MVRLIFISVADPAGGPGQVGPRVLRRVTLAPQMGWRGLSPVRYPAPRRILRAPVAGELPMRSGWLKPAPVIVGGARWSQWCALGGIAHAVWPTSPEV